MGGRWPINEGGWQDGAAAPSHTRRGLGGGALDPPHSSKSFSLFFVGGSDRLHVNSLALLELRALRAASGVLNQLTEFRKLSKDPSAAVGDLLVVDKATNHLKFRELVSAVQAWQGSQEAVVTGGGAENKDVKDKLEASMSQVRTGQEFLATVMESKLSTNTKSLLEEIGSVSSLTDHWTDKLSATAGWRDLDKLAKTKIMKTDGDTIEHLASALMADAKDLKENAEACGIALNGGVCGAARAACGLAYRLSFEAQFLLGLAAHSGHDKKLAKFTKKLQKESFLFPPLAPCRLFVSQALSPHHHPRHRPPPIL